MGHLFSKKKLNSSNNITEQDKAILQIKQQRDKVKQFQKKLAVQLEVETDIIRKLVQNDKKSKALLLLRKKKYTEKILEKIDNELYNIENLIMDIEFKKVEQNVLKCLQTGNETLKQLNAVFSIEQIESILDETDKGIHKQQEITDLISGYKETDEDEDALDQELETILGIDNAVSDLPNVPETDLPEKNFNKKPIDTKKTKIEKQLVEA
ncbi:hypothetical protein RDWZM_007251 [Blomia tropicalis]|uniref:Charged multivesicular body protein 6 n=1 Tax=Blomia tropicalis TaxID=40697 RepID=A0A9Q0RP50_BLOTA|nr:Charged multivesicular body protein 6 [Blomia tropicalis]KAJ6221439.1 hypothetical protein RDWZM_007251 [Blomia tropicalis]